MPEQERNCASCANPFTPRDGRHIYCSATCNSRVQMRKYRASHPEKYIAKKRRWEAKNKDRINEKQKQRYKSDPEFRRRVREWTNRSAFKSRYGITTDRRAEMLIEQGNRCANPGCRTDDPGPQGWHTDHCHRTGKVRGFLCRPCNLALGLMHENIPGILGLVEYLRKDQNDVGQEGVMRHR